MATLNNTYQLLKEDYAGNTGYGNVYLRLYAKLNSQDIANNKSNVSVQLRIYTEGAYWYQQTGGNWAIKVDENPIVGGQANQQFNVGETVIGTGTGDVQHNADGTKTNCGCLGSINFTAWGWTANCDTTATLPQINRASTLNSVTNSISTNGQTVKVKPNFTKNVNSYYQILKLFSADRNTTIATINGVANNTEYSLTSAQITTLYNYIGTRTTQVGVICDLETYTSNGGTYIGKTSALTYFQLPSYSISLTTSSITDTVTTYNTYKGSGNENKIYIANLSKPTFNLSAASSTGSYYGRSVTYKLGNTVINSSYTENNFSGQSFSFTATDGRKTSNTYTPTSPNFVIVPYVKPTLSVSITRTTPTGNTIDVSVSGTYYDGNGLTNLATPTVKLKYTESGGSEQEVTISYTTSTSNHITTFTGTTQLTNMNYQKSVTWNVTVSDKLNIKSTNSNTLPQGLPVWNGYRKNDTNYFNVNGILQINNKNMPDITRINTLNLSTTGGTAQESYYLIAVLQTGGNGDASNLRLIGTSGGFTRSGLASFDITMTSREVGGFGTWYGKIGAWGYFDIQIYRGTDNYYRVYLHRKNVAYHGNTNIIAMGAYCTLNCETTPSTPLGTLITTFDNKNLIKTNSSYSTDEQIVSADSNGKPVYEKSYEYTIPSGVNTWRSIGTISNVKRMWIINTDVPRGTEIYPRVDYDFYYNQNTSTFYERHSGTYYEGYKLYITIRYTKTTD